jgi:hypothetical protein
MQPAHKSPFSRVGSLSFASTKPVWFGGGRPFPTQATLHPIMNGFFALHRFPTIFLRSYKTFKKPFQPISLLDDG